LQIYKTMNDDDLNFSRGLFQVDQIDTEENLNKNQNFNKFIAKRFQRKTKEKRALEQKYLNLCVLSQNENFGEEDMIFQRNRTYSVKCISNKGQLSYLCKKDFFELIYCDLETKRYLLQKVKGTTSINL